MPAYYNEHDPFAAQWLRNLIAAGHIAAGDVDDRSILDVRPDDLRGYTQCHFFAGLGGWSYALRLAGVPDDRPVWTGSCPCQPFSVAGRQRAADDERHLWPAFFGLIRELGPRTVLGEQVAGAAGYAWWDAVAADLEGEGYAAAAADLGAHSVGAPHLRQRLYWVAHAPGPRPQGGDEPGQRPDAQRAAAQRGGAAGDVGHADDGGSQGGGDARGGAGVGRARPQPAGASADGGLGDSLGLGLSGAGGAGEARTAEPGPWDRLQWIPCRDGVARPTQPGLQPLAHGVSARVGRLRAYGNAIVPQVAAAFIRAAL